MWCLARGIVEGFVRWGRLRDDAAAAHFIAPSDAYLRALRELLQRYWRLADDGKMDVRDARGRLVQVSCAIWIPTGPLAEVFFNESAIAFEFGRWVLCRA
jgi:hypothetical protein